MNLCSDCTQDFYNDKNPYGIKECWFKKKLRKNAKDCVYKMKRDEN